jgi:hypothetical protein
MKGHISFKYKFSNYNYYPIVSVSLSNKKLSTKTSALIDSGASISIFSETVANTLNINIESGEKRVLGGVGGRIVGYVHNVKIKVAGKSFICPVVFSREYNVSINLLGRDTFFEKFRITFDEKEKTVILQ